MNPAQFSPSAPPCPDAASRPDVRDSAGADKRQPGADPSRWSDGLLELFLRHVGRADLTSCRHVCRRWHEAGASDSLQVDSFVNAWQPRERQQLLQAAARQLPPTASLVAVRRCLYRLIQERLQASRFVPRQPTLVEEPDLSRTIHELRCSPDNQFAALSFWGRGVGPVKPCRIRIYSLQPGPFSRVYHGGHGQPLRGLWFGADSRSLQAVDGAGQLYEWQRQDNGSWKVQEAVALCPPAADRVQASPDGNYMAVVDDGTDARNRQIRSRQPVLSLLGKTASGGWTCQYQWRCPRPFLHMGCQPLADLDFSQDSRVFMFTAAPLVCVCQRTDDQWTLQSLDAVCEKNGQALLAPDGKALAVTGNRGGKGYGAVPVGEVELWQPDEQRQWRITGKYGADWDSFTGCTMAFSPDSRQLVFADERGTDQGSLCLLQRTASGTFERPVRLKLMQASAMEGMTPSVTQLQFSATGGSLLARTREGIQIWRRGTGPADWLAAGWLAAEDMPADARQGSGGSLGGMRRSFVSGAFSPDSFHCVLFDSDQGHCSVWGPDHSGQYRQKVLIQPGPALHRVQFTDDGSQLLLAFVGNAYGSEPQLSGMGCLPLVPEPANAADSEGGQTAQSHQAEDADLSAERTVQPAI